MKKTSEELIDQALDTARYLQPPVGMTQRVLAHAENHAASNTSSTRARSFLMQLGFDRMWQAASAGAAVIVCVGLFTFVHVHGSHPLEIAMVQKRIAKPPANPHVVEPLAAEVVSPVHVSRTTGKETIPVQLLPANVETIVDDMHLPSRPAPERPLTDQEKILLHIAVNPDPVLISRLNPVEREIAMAQENAEFEKFFARPPAPDPPPENVPAANTEPSEKKAPNLDQSSPLSANDTTSVTTGDHQ